MAEIENPWHSRPLDVHRCSDHSEVGELVEKIWHKIPDVSRYLTRVQCP